MVPTPTTPSRCLWTMPLQKLVNKPQPIQVKGVLALKHVGGVGEPEALSRHLGGGVPDEPVKEGELFVEGGIVNNVAPELCPTVCVLGLLAFVDEESPDLAARELADGVVVEEGLNNEKGLRR